LEFNVKLLLGNRRTAPSQAAVY